MRLFFNSFRKYVSLLCLFLLLVCQGCSSPSVLRNEDARFEKFTNMLFCQEVSSNTLTLHYTLKGPENYGIKNAPVTYGTFSTDTIAAMASIENCIEALDHFSYQSLNEKNQLTYDVLESYFHTSQALAPYLLYQEPVNPTTGIQAQLPVLLSEYQFYSAEDIDTYLALLEKTPQYFESLAAFEQAKADAGLFMSSTVAEDVIAQCNSFLNMGDSNYLYTTFYERISELPGLSDSQEAQYLAKNKTQVDTYVLPAFQYFADVMESLRDSGKNDKGLCYLPNGRRFYEALVAHDTGSSRTITELQHLTKKQILTDLAAIQSELSRKQAAKSSGSMTGGSRSATSPDSGSATSRSGSSCETSIAVDEAISNPASIMKDLQLNYTAAFPKGPAVENTIKYVPEALEKFLSPAFYLIPAIDNSSENVIYINRGQTMNGIELYTTLAHEGYPGHLYQTTYFAATDPDPVRSILDFGGYTEGWATYTEMMSYYMSPLSSQQASLLQKNKSAILGLYALADMGIHHDGWTLEQTGSFFKNYGITEKETIENIYTMILSDPGNYLKYYIGYLEFLELKRTCAERDGNDFSQKEFHQTILETGPASFEILAKELGL